MDKKIEKLLITHANINKNEECCGFIVLDNIKQLLIVPCGNIYEFPKNGFKICPHEFLKIKQTYKIICLYHSHPTCGCEFSQKDLAQAEELCLPICVYSLQDESFNIHFPKSYKIKEFVGREYVDHFQNCWKFVYDYCDSQKQLKSRDFNFYLEKSADGKYPARTVLKITNFFKRNNFKKISFSEAMSGDLLIFMAANNSFTHFGILLDNNEFMHHPENFLSSKSLLNDDYIKKIHSVYRIHNN